MSPTKIMPQNKRSRSLYPLLALPLVAALQACSADVVNMGENPENPEQPELPASSRCRHSTTLTGEIIVRNQEQLNELEGCEVIDGSLMIAAFAGADLRPLHALTRIEGPLDLPGQFPVTDGAEDEWIERYFASGWLSSLEGLESLERAGGLAISGLSAASLEPLENLRTLDNGTLFLGDCPNLRDLRGLEGLREFSTFYMFSENLESIAALRMPDTMDEVHITSPKLVDLGRQRVRYIASNLILIRTALENLDGFAELRSIGDGLVVEANPYLKDTNALNELRSLGGLVVRSNAELTRLPNFESLYELSTLMIYDNPRLTELPQFGALYEIAPADSGLSARDRGLRLDLRLDHIEVVGNPELLRFAVPVAWRDGELVVIENNMKLREVDFGRLESIDLLSIRNNPALANVSLGALSRVDVLSVLENPSLQSSSFDAVQAFEREMVGNADAP